MPAKNQISPQTKIIIEMIKSGTPYEEIRKKCNCSPSRISTIKKRYLPDLPSLSRSGSKYNWGEIQSYYDEGYSFRDLFEKFGVYPISLARAKKRGDFKSREAKETRKMTARFRPFAKSTEASRTKARNTIAQKVQDGTWHYSFSKVRTHEFVSKFAGRVKVMGKWELEFAQYLDDNNIEWRQPKEKFYYEFSGLKNKSGYYIPDFFLVQENVYVEVKGYETDKDRAKWKWFPLKLIVLKEQELREQYGLKLSTKN